MDTEHPVTLASSVEELEVYVRTYHGMKTAGIQTIGELVTWSPRRLMTIRHVGALTVVDLQQELARHGFALAEEPPREQHFFTRCPTCHRKWRHRGAA